MPTPFQPGDKLRVIVAHAYGTTLEVGDLVTVLGSGVHTTTGLRIVKVSTLHGTQLLGLDAVEPWSPPTYTPAEPDEIIDARLRAIATAEPDLATWATDADTALGAVEADVSAQLANDGEHVESRREVGPPLRVTDVDGDELEITYCEETTPPPGNARVSSSLRSTSATPSSSRPTSSTP